MNLESELKKNTEALERNNALLEKLLENHQRVFDAVNGTESPPENVSNPPKPKPETDHVAITEANNEAPKPPAEVEKPPVSNAPPPPTDTEPVQEQTGYQGTREELFQLTQAKFDETKNEGAIRDLLKSFGCNGIHDLPEDKFVEFAAKLTEVKPI